MKNKDLIKKLQTKDPEKEVFASVIVGFSDGYPIRQAQNVLDVGGNENTEICLLVGFK